jgi:hypothetical protein
MVAWFGSPRLIDLILMFTLIEAFILMIWRRAHPLSLRRIDIGLMLLPGVFLMLALRAALAGAPWPCIVTGCSTKPPSSAKRLPRSAAVPQ